MGVYTRYKKDPEGFRTLVELLESTPKDKRQRMIDVGMEEDPEYTRKALSYMFSFDDLCNLPDMELAEVVAAAPPRMTANSLKNSDPEVRERFMKNAIPKVAAQIREFDDEKAELREIGAARLKLITVARSLERQGKIKSKQIPRNFSG